LRFNFLLAGGTLRLFPSIRAIQLDIAFAIKFIIDTHFLRGAKQRRIQWQRRLFLETCMTDKAYNAFFPFDKGQPVGILHQQDGNGLDFDK